MSRLVALAALAFWLCVASAAQAAATPVWRTQTLDQAHGGLLAVSCVSPTFCMAVGSIEGRKRGVTLAELYNGSDWTVLPTPNVRGTTDNELLGVSCSSGTSCTAVGFRQNKQGAARTLAEQWNGLAWSIDSAPFVFHSGLAAVSCASPTACTAVGGSGSFPDSIGSALAERWNGTSWAIERIPKLRRHFAEALRGVSCVSARLCTAVGEQYDSNVDAFYGVVLNTSGHGWSTKLKYGDVYDEYAFNAVTCRTARRCIAVGQLIVPSGGTYGIWARRNRGRWKTPRSNIVADNQDLDGLACTSPRACLAVGGIRSSHAYAELWNGSSWTFDQVSASVNMGLDAVSCSSKASCVAVGVFQRVGRPSYPAVAVTG